jgi:hypothetical protein
MLPLIALLVVGGMYLAVNAQLTRAGRRVLDLQEERANLLRQHEEYTSVLAELTSPQRMMEHALELGFEPATPNQIEYVIVEGYADPEPFVAPRPPDSPAMGEGTLSPAYTETLGEWMLRLLGLESGGAP